MINTRLFKYSFWPFTLIKQINNLNDEKQTLAEQLATFSKENLSLINQINNLNKENKTLTEQLTRQINNLNEQNQTLSELTAQINHLNNEKQIMAEQLTDLGEENLALHELTNDLNKEKHSLNEKNLALTYQLEILTTQNQALTQEIHIFSNEKVLMEKEIMRGKLPIHEIAGTLNWPEILNTFTRLNGFSELIRIANLHASANCVVDDPSICWDLLAIKNYDQLLTHGFNNFKRTINHNYFNFLIQQGDIQIKAAEALLSPELQATCRDIANSMPNDPQFNIADQTTYFYFVLLLWEYAKTLDRQNHMDRLTEPDEGSPLIICSAGKKISQDLANSVIEYYSMSEEVSFAKCNTVLEIGSGYGRNAFVILTLNPHIKMTLVDIPPALYIAQRYLSSIFKDRPVFMARDFSSYEEVQTEMEAAAIIFLLPHQLALIPDKHYNLSINISSFGEMRMDQLTWYFSELNRLTKHYFYTKQWQVSKNPFDGIELKRNDYPYPANWRPIYNRNCAVQTEFFEALYEMCSEPYTSNL